MENNKKKRKYVRYFTKDKLEKVNEKSVKAYEKYRKSCIIKNKDVEESTYKVYQNYFNHFLVYLSEEWDNIYILDEEFFEEAIDIMEGFIAFCQDTLGNNKKVINTKLSAVSSYYQWAYKRGMIDKHPFSGKLERMKHANEEKLINHYFLNEEQIKEITRVLEKEHRKGKDGRFDIQDRLLWHIAIDSGSRNGALHRLSWSKLNWEDMMFEEIREKLGKIVEVPFEEQSYQLLLEWHRLRKDIDNLECDAIFITKHNGEYKRMSKTALYMRVRKIGTIIGLEDLHPHCLRKTVGNRVVEMTGDLDLARELLNHEDISTTQKHYVKPKSKAEIREKLKKLRNKKK